MDNHSEKIVDEVEVIIAENVDDSEKPSLVKEDELEEANPKTLVPSDDFADNNIVPSSAVTESSSSTTLLSAENEDDNVINKTAIPKVDRRRFKKLDKRAHQGHNNVVTQQVSGITSRNEWKEYKVLLEQYNATLSKDESPKRSPTVRVNWRGGKVRPNTEGNHHRDLLFKLIMTACSKQQQQQQEQQQQQGKKRKYGNSNGNGQSELPTNIPGWATLHNPAAADHVAVIEINITGSGANILDKQNEINNRLRQLLIQKKASTGKSKKISNKPIGDQSCVNVMQADIRWFQGTKPRSISDVLMYSYPVDQESSNKKAKANVTNHTNEKSRNVADLYKLLEPLLATTSQMLSEGYPKTSTMLPKDNDDVLAQRKSFLDKYSGSSPNQIPLEETISFLHQFQVKEENCKDTTECDYDKRPLYVKTVLEPCNKGPKIYAVDCEMVKSDHASELARITLVELLRVDNVIGDNPKNSEYEIKTKVVWDQIVKPQNAVRDYVTEYSGITAAMLDGSDVVRVEQVQAALLATIRKNDIIIGHSLENDLRASRWVHDTIIDTSILFRDPSKQHAFKFSLRHLAAVLLKKQIQQSDQPHCSEEDAVTAMELAIRRALEGPSFGIFNKTQLNRLGELTEKSTAVCVGPFTWLQRHVLNGKAPNSIHALQCESISEPNAKAIAAWLTGKTRKANLVWGNFEFDVSEKKFEECFTGFEKYLKELLPKLPANAVLLVALQHGFREAEELNRTRRVRQNPKTTIQWTSSEEGEWRQAIDNCRRGIVFWIAPKAK